MLPSSNADLGNMSAFMSGFNFPTNAANAANPTKVGSVDNLGLLAQMVKGFKGSYGGQVRPSNGANKLTQMAQAMGMGKKYPSLGGMSLQMPVAKNGFPSRSLMNGLPNGSQLLSKGMMRGLPDGSQLLSKGVMSGLPDGSDFVSQGTVKGFGSLTGYGSGKASPQRMSADNPHIADATYIADARPYTSTAGLIRDNLK